MVPTPLLVLIAVAVIGFSLLCLVAIVVWRQLRHDDQVRELSRRITKLPWRDKLRLAWRLMKDRRIPGRVRLIPPALVLYLASPIDIIPDFIPVIGQLDDILVLGIGIGLMVKLIPTDILNEQLLRLETEPQPQPPSTADGP